MLGCVQVLKTFEKNPGSLKMMVTKQLVARLAAIPAVVLSEPASSFVTEAVLVLGPAMTKLLKSTRSWKLINYNWNLSD